MYSLQDAASSSSGHTMLFKMSVCSEIDASESRYSCQLSTVGTQFPHSEEVSGLNMQGQAVHKSVLEVLER